MLTLILSVGKYKKKNMKCTKYNDDTGSFYPESYYIFTKVREFILNKNLFQKTTLEFYTHKK